MRHAAMAFLRPPLSPILSPGIRLILLPRDPRCAKLYPKRDGYQAKRGTQQDDLHAKLAIRTLVAADHDRHHR